MANSSFRELKVWQEGMILVEDVYQAYRLGFLSPNSHIRLQDRTEQIGRMLNGLINALKPEGWPRE